MWRLHIEMTEAKAFRTFIRIYSLLGSEQLITKIILTLHKELVRSVFAPLGEIPTSINFSACNTGYSPLLENFLGAHWFTICKWLSDFYMCMIIQGGFLFYCLVPQLCTSQQLVYHQLQGAY
jgi:hypothetical protein